MATLQIKAIRCGKPNCNSCPHMFYLYAYWKEGGRTKCRYVGKLGTKELQDKIKEMGEWKQWQELFREHKATYGERAYGDPANSKGKKNKTGQRRTTGQESSSKNQHQRSGGSSGQAGNRWSSQGQKEQAQDEAIREIENFVKQHWDRLNIKDQDKIEKLLALIKDRAVHAGEKAAAISAIRRIFQRKAI